MIYRTKTRSSLVCAIYGDLDTLVISPENFLQITSCNERHVHMINILLKVCGFDQVFDVFTQSIVMGLTVLGAKLSAWCLWFTNFRAQILILILTLFNKLTYRKKVHF